MAECEINYRKTLANAGLIGAGDTQVNQGEAKEEHGIIADIRSAVVSGNTHYYVRMEHSLGYLDFNAAEVPRAVLLDVGDSIWYTYRLVEASFPENGIVPATAFRFEGEEAPTDDFPLESRA